MPDPDVILVPEGFTRLEAEMLIRAVGDAPIDRCHQGDAMDNGDCASCTARAKIEKAMVPHAAAA